MQTKEQRIKELERQIEALTAQGEYKLANQLQAKVNKIKETK